MRIALVFACFTGLAWAWPRPALAADAEADECSRAARDAQSLSDDGHLLAARAKASLCAADACPATTRTACSARLAALEQRIPSLVLAVTDADGNDLADVRVTMDGRPLVDRTDGHAVLVEIGPHTLRFAADGFEPVTQAIVAREAETDRRLQVRLERTTASAPPSPPAPAPATPLPPIESSSPPLIRSRVPAYVAFGVAGAGLVVGASYGLIALHTNSKLEASCPSGACPALEQPTIDALGRQALLSNIGFGVGIAGALAGGVLYWMGLRGEQEAARQGLHAWIGPGMAGVAGTLP